MEPPSSSPLRELAVRSDRSYSCLGNYNALDANLDDHNPKEKAETSRIWAAEKQLLPVAYWYPSLAKSPLA